MTTLPPVEYPLTVVLCDWSGAGIIRPQRFVIVACSTRRFVPSCRSSRSDRTVLFSVYEIGSEVAVVPAATVVPLFPPPQVIRVIALVFGAVVAGPIPAPVMFSAARG